MPTQYEKAFSELERLRKLLAEVENYQDSDFNNEDNGHGDVFEENFSDHENFSEQDNESEEDGRHCFSTYQKKAVLNLIEDWRNVPNHVLREHNKCKETCKRKDLESDEIVYPLMRSSGLLHAIESEIGRILVACSNTLIWNATNNPSENYMSQVCKVSGGKRIDFSKSSGFNNRSTIAALAFQSPAQKWYKEYYKSLTKKSPTISLQMFCAVRRNRYLKRLKRRKLFQNEKFKQRKNRKVPLKAIVIIAVKL
ncbi:hypothetical protein AVEN_9182-1 [Araneus ventricosus]|uniref:Uncharacterized protein n=1 Tax=Araneus ventricosus TaxID=182803 RepID=A0A4Y2UEY9_ARAVE|nr:hypothetical protein AVEN_9182-1 [Araneus ventricosus]